MTLYDDKRCRFVLLTMVLSLAGAAVCATIRGGWQSAMVLNVVIDTVLVGYIVRNRDALLLRLLIMALAAGVVEVAISDPYFVGNHTLVYPQEGPFIIDSPLYMPLGWAYVLLQLGYVAWWVMQQKGDTAAILVSTLLGGTNIPMYEALARRADWWHYQDVPMILGAPYYVILGEAFIGLALPFIVKPLANRSVISSVWLGLALGVWTLISGLLAFWIAG
jgi:uncharacterized protein DUF6989